MSSERDPEWLRWWVKREARFTRLIGLLAAVLALASLILLLYALSR